MSDKKKIQELETRVCNIAEQQELILVKMEMLINMFKNMHEPESCLCGGKMIKIESKYPNTSIYWECTSCGNTFIPTE